MGTKLPTDSIAVENGSHEALTEKARVSKNNSPELDMASASKKIDELEEALNKLQMQKLELERYLKSTREQHLERITAYSNSVKNTLLNCKEERAPQFNQMLKNLEEEKNPDKLRDYFQSKNKYVVAERLLLEIYKEINLIHTQIAFLSDNESGSSGSDGENHTS